MLWYVREKKSGKLMDKWKYKRKDIYVEYLGLKPAGISMTNLPANTWHETDRQTDRQPIDSQVTKQHTMWRTHSQKISCCFILCLFTLWQTHTQINCLRDTQTTLLFLCSYIMSISVAHGPPCFCGWLMEKSKQSLKVIHTCVFVCVCRTPCV